MPLGTQARLLRVLEAGEFIRVGSSKVQKTDVRVIAASNRDLLEFAQQGKFREDLYYRLSTVPIRVPALRDRKEDIPLLFRKFATDFAERYKTLAVQLDSAAQQLLVSYPWYGNVRELKNIAEQISVLSTEKNINADTLQQFLPVNAQSRSLAIIPTGAAGSPAHSPNDYSNTERDILYKLFFDLKKDMNDLKKMFFDMAHQSGYSQSSISEAIIPAYNAAPEPIITPSTYNNTTPILLHPTDQHEEVDETLLLSDREKEFILKALKKHKGRRRDAANELGISERTLYRKIKEYNINE